MEATFRMNEIQGDNVNYREKMYELKMTYHLCIWFDMKSAMQIACRAVSC